VNRIKHIPAFFSFSDFDQEERTRFTGILNVVAQCILVGFVVLFLPRAVLGHLQLYEEILAAGVLVFLAVVFLRQGKVLWAEKNLLWTLLASIIYLMVHSTGLHNNALLGVPILLVFAGIVLRAQYFYVFTILTVLSIAVIGGLEVSGRFVHPLSQFTSYLDIVDITVILTATAIAIRTLVKTIVRSTREAKNSEQEIHQQGVVIKESEEKFRTLTEELPNMVYILKNEKIVYANEQCREFVGFTREELCRPDFNVLTMIAPEDRSMVKEKNHRLMKGEKIDPFECAFLDKGGDRIPYFYITKMIHFDGGPAVLCLISDVSNLHHAEEEIQESENRLQSIITSVLEGILTLDERYIVRSFNPAAEAMFRCHSHEAIGQSISRFVSFTQPMNGNGQDTGRRQSSPIESLEGKVQTINGIRVNGEQFPIEASMTKVKVGYNFMYTLVLRDITARLRSEERQRELQAQLLQSQKMEAVGALAGGIAHDFNNILSIIIGNAELVKLKVDPGHPAEKNIDELLNSSERAQELVQQILTFSRKQEAKLRPVRLNNVLGEGMKLLRASLPSTVHIKLDLPSSGPLVLADATQMHQVLMNLCTNSASAMQGRNGKLTIRQKVVEFDDRAVLFHPDLHKGQYVMFTVQDNGHGMDGFTLKRIFEPFFTTKEPGKGTGLGLSIVQSIMKNHGGAVLVKSELGKGTEVEVYLPIFLGEEDNLPAGLRQEANGGEERILVVDDEKPLLDALVELLQKLGYRPSAFTSSEEAMQAFEKDPHGFDLILTDQTMPHMTGVALAHRVTQIRKNIPIVLITGYDQLEDPEKMEALGIQAVLLKPFRKSALSETIKKALKKDEGQALLDKSRSTNAADYC